MIFWLGGLYVLPSFLRSTWNLLTPFSCVVSSIVRLVYFVQLNSSFVTPERVFSRKSFLHPSFFCLLTQFLPLAVVANLLFWSVLEPCVSIVTACLPTLGPLVTDHKAPGFLYSLRSLWGRVLHSKNGSETMLDELKEPHRDRNNWQKLPPGSVDYHTHIAAGRTSEATVVGHDLEAGGAGAMGIKIDQTITSSS